MRRPETLNSSESTRLDRVPPRDRAALTALPARSRGGATGHPEALDAARFILRHPPLPWPARAPPALLAANAITLLPPWASALLGLRPVTGPRTTCARLSGHALTRTIRWAMAPPSRPTY
ncbi:oxygenase MpaB family protein [Streptomyces sp. H27-H1]|uniref:oxygenase MpaB family protein n=1 Tax=Streptomyces sp. H27-H1 TaxID=2996461 RepID=UPI002D1E3A3B|nr:oxygenase MpaB family protein [Streptomyces sp. H27-H1]